MPSKTAILSLMAATLSVAAPLDTAAPSCPGFYLVEKWGATFSQPVWNSSMIGTFKGCKSGDLSKRQDYDTKVETNDGTIKTSYVADTDKPEDLIWARALELCGETLCDGTKEISVSSGRSSSAEGTELYLNLDGRFPDGGLRDNFISLVKDAFYKSITEESDPSNIIYTHTGVSLANGITTYGEASGYYLTMRMRNGNPGSGASCPDAVNLINSFGALVPQLGVVFGLAGAICGGLD